MKYMIKQLSFWYHNRCCHLYIGVTKYRWYPFTTAMQNGPSDPVNCEWYRRIHLSD